MDFEIRPDRHHKKRRGLPRERAVYFELVAQGVSMSEACRIVGIHRRTGSRWSHPPTGPTQHQREQARPKAVLPTADRSRTLSVQERVYIADRLAENASIRVVAGELGRSPSTVSREVRRNRHPTNLRYRPYAAQERAQARRPRPKPRKVYAIPELLAYVRAGLKKRWSPEQIVRRLRHDFPDRPDLFVSHEAVYQAIYVQGRGELRRELAAALRTGRAVRRPRKSGEHRSQRMTTPMVMISERPAEVADRAVPGHWEGDLIIGKDQQSAIGTLVERTTRYVMLVHLPAGRSPAQLTPALVDTISHLPDHLRRSLTWDQGTEMSWHHKVTMATDMAVYFCDPHSPWQRGSNENTNGLLRQYFPKGTDLAVHTREDLDNVAAELNGRPRKTLHWDTPAEQLLKIITSPPTSSVATTP